MRPALDWKCTIIEATAFDPNWDSFGTLPPWELIRSVPVHLTLHFMASRPKVLVWVCSPPDQNKQNPWNGRRSL